MVTQAQALLGRWVTALAVVVVLILTPLAVLQYRQYESLSSEQPPLSYAVAWKAVQLEREHDHFADVLAQASVPHGRPDAAALGQALSRLRTAALELRDAAQPLRSHESPDYRAAVAPLQSLIAASEAALGAAPTGPIPPEDAASLRASSEALRPLLATLAEKSRVHTRQQIDDRDRALRQQGVLVTTLAVVQGLVLLVFMVFLVHHIRRQLKQNQALQDLTVHLQAARAEADAANQGKSAFLANMSHEIRTPFQGLLGMLNLLGESALSDKQRDYVQTARDSAHHLLGILNDILDVSTMESGSLKLATTPVRLAAVVKEAQALMRVPAQEKGLDFKLTFHPGVPEWVLADPTRLRQILFNLINNAIKFTEHGSVNVEVRPVQGERRGVAIDIIDTGPGMDEATAAQLFKRFYRADNSVKRRYGGTGLGLEISRNLARLMGGDIEVRSHPGEGSVFTVLLPLSTVPAPVPAPPPPDSGERRLHVLAVEDHPINLKYLSILLEKMGHEATLCENGQEAVAQVAQGDFDVVLMDLHMPVMDGLSATRAIRALPGPASQVKIILVTADVVNDTREQALLAGVDAFAAKPLESDELRRALQHCGLLSTHGQGSSYFPVSIYDVPMGLPAARQTDPMDHVDGPSLREMLSLMPAESLGDLLHELFNEPSGAVHALLAAVGAGERQAIGLAAHKLKGTCMLLGLKTLVRSTSALEHLTRQTNDPVPPGTLERLRFEIDKTRQALAALGVQFHGDGDGPTPGQARWL